ncbi:PREDICTED: cysteine-rich and transmembrane domain-containing protein B-like [Theobroma cacao]|uniref:Cysteine-rich and transmembrane domain-containing protein B-like n=1 Tax=Theobroma cacao TaxID=3641 RepID=A0AB32WJT4_THECC|nr:PREDICTED: cysteine-rich and transmembrane domain-containing protein B-like [Theobroma cacao]
MAHYDQQQAPAYPRPSEVYQPPQQCYPAEKAVEMHANAPPPPVGYPTMGGAEYPRHAPPVQTQSKGDDFWKGCFAALCCCCVLDMCFC